MSALQKLKIDLKGFTLVEILVAISILAVISVVAVPNLRNFSSTQDLDHTAINIESVLKTAQSSANSGVKCPADETSEYWKVKLTKTTYSLIAKCQTLGERVLSQGLISPSQSDPGESFESSIDVCPNVGGDIIFTPNKVSYQCSGNSLSFIADIKIVLQNSSGSLTKSIRINKGGSIKIE